MKKLIDQIRKTFHLNISLQTILLAGYVILIPNAKQAYTLNPAYKSCRLYPYRFGRRNTITTLLSKAFKKASGLPDSLQDQLARQLLEELEWELKWEPSIKNSSDKIDKLAEQALHEYKAGKTSEIGIDEL